MNILTGLKAFTPVIRRTNQILKLKAPAICLGAGIIGGVTAAVIAVKNTPAVIDAKKSFKESMEIADECREKGSFIDKEDAEVSYSLETYHNDAKVILGRKYLAYMKAYAPAIGLGCLSIVMILTSHKLLVARNAALTATVASVSEAFKRYRNNVKAEYGNEVDYNMRHSVVSEKVKETVTDPVTEKKSVVTKTVRKRRDGDLPWRSDYARCYDEFCKSYTRNPTTNYFHLKAIQEIANNKLNMDGYLFLNDVYELLNIDKTLAGSEMGWIKGTDRNPNEYGDSYVDFGFMRDTRFVNGDEASVWLDFNVDELPIKTRIKWAVK